MLTDEQRKEWFNSASLGPNAEVPFVMEPVFSEYCSTKLQSDICSVEGNIDSLSTASSPVALGVGWTK